jgi:hypothetical protein
MLPRQVGALGLLALHVSVFPPSGRQPQSGGGMLISGRLRLPEPNHRLSRGRNQK